MENKMKPLNVIFVYLSLNIHFITFCNCINKIKADDTSAIVEYLDIIYDNFTLSRERDIVMVLGSTGPGKSTITLHLTGNKLRAVKDEATGELLVVDEDDKIGTSPNIAKTIIPERMYDRENSIVYYDLPGYYDKNTDIKYDISNTYLIQKLWQHARHVKLIFTLHVDTITSLTAVDDFREFVMQSLKIIENFGKYRNGIGLVITQVPDNTSSSEEQLIRSNVDKIKSLMNKLKSDNAVKDKKLKDFFSILLQQDREGRYSHIRIHRKVKQLGMLEDMKTPHLDKQSITKMIKSLSFVKKDDDDFGYTLSDNTQKKVQKIIEDLVKRLTKDVNTLVNGIKSFYEKLEKQAKNNTHKFELYNNAYFACEKLSQIQYESHRSLAEGLIRDLPSLQINGASGSLKSLEKYIEFVGFFNQMTNLSTPSSFLPDTKILIKSFVKDLDKYKDSKDKLKIKLGAQQYLKEKLINRASDIFAEIEKFYLNQEKKTSDLSVIDETMTLGYERLFASSSSDLWSTKDLRRFRNLIIRFVSDLKIEIPDEIFDDFKSTINTIFSLKLPSEDILSNLLKNDAVKKTKIYLFETIEWYKLLHVVHTALSEYKMQNKTEFGKANDMIKSVSALIKGKENNSFKLSQTKILEYAKRIDQTKNTFNLKQMILNSNKLKMFNALLGLVTQNSTSDNSSNRLLVKGYNVKLSDFKNDINSNEIQHIRVFALNKIFVDIDIDKTGKENQILFIAPEVEVVSERTIILNGASGESHDVPAPNEAVASGAKGNGGKAGKPGGPAGKFSCIAFKFSNSGGLKIQANGGTGGPGQNGGWGGDGVNGTTPPYERKSGMFISVEQKNIDLWQKGNFSYTVVPNSSVEYIVYPLKFIEPGDGGDGGRGGNGGFAGELNIIGLNNSVHKFSLSNKEGDLGRNGMGGERGSPSQDGNTIEVSFGRLPCCPGAASVFFDSANDTYEVGQRDEANKGNDGKSTRDLENAIKLAELNSIPLSHSINDYKTYSRKNVAHSIRESDISEFVKELEEDKKVQSLYNVDGFINEYHSIEGHYFNLREKLQFSPAYESFVTRMDEYVRTHNLTDEEKTVFSYLGAAALSKSISSVAHQRTIIDLPKYMKLVKEHVNDLNHASREKQIKDVRKRYIKSISEQVKSARQLINDDIITEINSILNEGKNDIITSVNNVIDDAEKNLQEAELERRELEKKLAIKSVFSVLKGSAAVTSVFVPVASAAVTALEFVEGIVNTFTDGGARANLVRNDEEVTSIMKDHPVHEHEEVSQLLFDIESRIQTSKDSFNFTLNEINKLKSQINAAREKNEFLPLEVLKTIEEALEKDNEEIKKSNSDEAKKNNFADILDRVDEILTVGGDFYSVYKEIKDNYKQMGEVKKAIDKMKSDLDKWKYNEKRIHDNVNTMFIEARQYIKELYESANGQSQAYLLVHKWKLSMQIRIFKNIFSDITEEFSMHDQFNSLFVKLEDSLNAIIDVYNQIESLLKTAKFAEYIYEVQSEHEIRSSNIALKDTITELDLTIQTNLVREEHELVIHVFKQHYFPFAQEILKEMTSKNIPLPSNLKFEDMESLKNEAIRQIDRMEEALIQWGSKLQNTNNYLHNQVDFFGKGKQNRSPFYTWKYDEIKSKVSKLLNGKEIRLKADINKGVDFFAIKFNQIGINLKIRNEAIGRRAEKALQKVYVEMKMIGNSYYRCGERIYYTPADESFIIGQMLLLDTKRAPREPNGPYYQIMQNNQPILSPYTTWSIQLKNTTNLLRELENEVIDIELVGRGEFLDNNEYVIDEYCNENLDGFYTLNSVQRFKKH
ncbi:uncharacterized protein LOC116351742 [Contarinia nasturtii]|uniref:uncharacterized protein LOC116351742 n=1 Tax=Contarinia nasturtii TaxID=265458 RepID=UPI0012D48EFB|nr:uncharacterized protein LOC116351742 [Contarinia nasturtii]